MIKGSLGFKEFVDSSSPTRRRRHSSDGVVGSLTGQEITPSFRAPSNAEFFDKIPVFVGFELAYTLWNLFSPNWVGSRRPSIFRPVPRIRMRAYAHPNLVLRISAFGGRDLSARRFRQVFPRTARLWG